MQNGMFVTKITMKYREIQAWYDNKGFENSHTMRYRGAQTWVEIGQTVSSGDPTAITNTSVVS